MSDVGKVVGVGLLVVAGLAVVGAVLEGDVPMFLGAVAGAAVGGVLRRGWALFVLTWAGATLIGLAAGYGSPIVVAGESLPFVLLLWGGLVLTSGGEPEAEAGHE